MYSISADLCSLSHPGSSGEEGSMSWPWVPTIHNVSTTYSAYKFGLYLLYEYSAFLEIILPLTILCRERDDTFRYILLHTAIHPVKSADH